MKVPRVLEAVEAHQIATAAAHPVRVEQRGLLYVHERSNNLGSSLYSLAFDPLHYT